VGTFRHLASLLLLLLLLLLLHRSRARTRTYTLQQAVVNVVNEGSAQVKAHLLREI